jgi:hypothetical protein
MDSLHKTRNIGEFSISDAADPSEGSSRTRGLKTREVLRRALSRPTATQERQAECALRQPISRVGEVTTSLFRRVERLDRVR